MIWGGFHKGHPRPKMGGSMYRHGLQAGRILSPGTPTTDPVADDPIKPAYRLYRVRPNVNPKTPLPIVQPLLMEELNLINRFNPTTVRALYDQYIADWNEWPARSASNPNGLAPFNDINGDGLYDPNCDIPGQQDADQTLYYVANDANPTLTQNLLGSLPIGLETHRTIWGVNQTGFLKNMIFSSITLINKSSAPVDSMFASLWVDPDVGYTGDDFTGCDTTLDLGYAYQARDLDATYGRTAPATGFLLLQGPTVPGTPRDTAWMGSRPLPGTRQLGMSAFVALVPTWSEEPVLPPPETPEYYNYLNGLDGFGRPFVDPHVSDTTTFVFPGDPVTGSGWTDTQPHDRRFILSSGPFSMAPDDTQQILTAHVTAQGRDRFESVMQLKDASRQLQAMIRGMHRIWLAGTDVTLSYPSVGQVAAHVTIDAHGHAGRVSRALLTTKAVYIVSNIPMFDDGTHGDALAHDGIYSGTATLPRQLQALNLDVEFTDQNGTSIILAHLAENITTAGPVEVSLQRIFSDNINGDGRINPGENVRLGVAVANRTPFTLSGLTVICNRHNRTVPLLYHDAADTTRYDPSRPETYVAIDFPGNHTSIESPVFITDTLHNEWRDVHNTMGWDGREWQADGDRGVLL